MQAPLSVVTLHSGETVELSSFYADKPMALVFLRHFGCVFCREQITQLRAYSNANVVMVAMGKVEETAKFRERMESPQVYISDPNKILYEQFGLRRGSFAQMLNPNTFKRGFAATRAGNKQGLPVNDPWMLAGTFIIQPGGIMSFSHYSRDASDNLSGETIIELLESGS